MKVIVKHNFEDKHTGEFQTIGTVLDVTEERMKEIQKVGDFVEVLKVEPPESEAEQSESEVEPPKKVTKGSRKGEKQNGKQ